MGSNGALEHDTGSKASTDLSIAHLLKLGALCLGVALAVIGVVVYLTPMEDLEPLTEEVQSEGTSFPQSTVQLPQSAAQLTNEQLQSELTREIERLQEKYPTLPEALHLAAMAYAGLRQTQKAEELWRKCIELVPTQAGPRIGLATLLTDRGEDQAAVETLEAALASGCASPELFYRLATAQTKLGDVKGAQTTLLTAVESYPYVSENWLLLGQTHNQLQHYEQAEDSLRKALELGNQSSTVYFALANACQRQGKTEDAQKFRQRFSELKDNGQDAFQDRTFQEIYQQALRPMVVSILSTAATVYAKQGDPSKSEDLFLRALEIEPANPQTLELLTSFYRNSGRIADACLTQERLVQLAPGSTVYLMNHANLLAQLGDLESARQALEKARTARPDLALPCIALAQLHSQMGDFEQARLFAEGAIRREPSVQGFGLLATICQAMGDDEAAADARQAAKSIAAPVTVPNLQPQP